MTGEPILQAKDESLTHLRKVYGDDAETIIADARYGYISGLIKDVLEKPAVERLTITDNVDKVVLNRLLGLPIFVAILYGLFQLAFAVSFPFQGWIDAGFGWLAAAASGISPAWLGSLVAEGIIGGVGSVLVFVPVIFMLYIGLSILEDSGYLARAAFVMDRLMHRIKEYGT